MSGGIKREQGRDTASQEAAWQDRSTYITDGGDWSWDAGTDQLSWSSTIVVRRAGVADHTVAAGSAALNAAGQAMYITLDRTGGGEASDAIAAISDPANQDEDRIVLAVRSNAGRVHLFDGTVLSDGETKQLGVGVPSTNRDEAVSDGSAAQTVGFSYTRGSGELAVFVEGVLQRLGTDYLETTSTLVTFQGGSVPANGEIVTFLGLAGTTGPAGPGIADLEEAYTADPVVDTVSGTPVQIRQNTGLGTDALLQVGDDSALDRFEVWRNGTVSARNAVRIRDNTTGNYWILDVQNDDLVVYHDATNFAVRLADAGSGLEFGSFDGSSFSGGGGPLRWTEYAGTFSGGAPTVISTGLGADAIKGALLSANDLGLSHDALCEIGLGSNATRALFVSQAGGTVTISGDRNASAVVGSQHWGRAYRLIVFHE